MKKAPFIALIVLIIGSVPAFSQTSMLLQHRKHPNRIKKVRPFKEYVLVTGDMSYVGNVLSTNDSSIRFRQSEFCTHASVSGSGSEGDEFVSTEFVTRIPNDEAVKLHRPVNFRSSLFEPLGWIGFTAVAAVAAYPFALASGGWESMQSVLQAQVTLLGIGLAITGIGAGVRGLILLSRRSFDLQNDWKIMPSPQPLNPPTAS